MRILLCAVMLGALAAAVPAAAQVPGPDRTILIAPPPTATPPLAPLVSAVNRLRATNPNLIVQRILSFDADGDGRVAAAELPERMQELVGRIDKSEDGWISEQEIRNSIETRFTVRTGNAVLRPEDSGFNGVVNDLKLPASKREQALAIVKSRTTVRNLNEGAAGDVYARLRELLDDEEYENFVAAARRLSFSNVVVGGVVGGVPGVTPAIVFPRGSQPR